MVQLFLTCYLKDLTVCYRDKNDTGTLFKKKFKRSMSTLFGEGLRESAKRRGRDLLNNVSFAEASCTPKNSADDSG